MNGPFHQPVFGSEQPQNTQNSNDSGAQNLPQGQPNAAPQTVAELERLEKFKFDGKEYTPDQLRRERMLHADYTKKTQELSKERKFYDNLRYDLEKVRKNPALIDEFRQIYPEKFHAYLEMIEARAQANQSRMGDEMSGEERADLSPEVKEKLERFESYVRDQETSKHEAILEAKFSTLSKKYPDAIEDMVLARAQSLLDHKVQLTDQVWDKLWKESHNLIQSKVNNKQKTTLEAQREANKRASDTGSNGGTPGQAPAKMKLKDVADFAINDLRTRKA
jgi:hypothetical protein